MNEDLETRILRGPTIEYENEAEAKNDYEYQQYQNSLDYKISSSSSTSSSSSSSSGSLPSSLPHPIPRPEDDILNASRRGKLPSSGPKAVLADKAYADKLAIIENDRKILQKQHLYSTIGNGRTLLNLDNTDPDNQSFVHIPSISLASEQQRYQDERQRRERHHKDSDEEEEGNNSLPTDKQLSKDTRDTVIPTAFSLNNQNNEEEEDEYLLDDAFLANYRNQRLAQLKQQSFLYSTVYGTVTEIRKKDDLPSIIDTTNPHIYVLCLLYETYIAACTPWRKAWKELAIQYPTQVRFLCMETSIVSPTWDPISLPSLAIYKNKETIHSIVRLQNNEEKDDEGIGSGLGMNPDTYDIERWLLRKGWLPPWSDSASGTSNPSWSSASSNSSSSGTATTLSRASKTNRLSRSTRKEENEDDEDG